MKTLQNYLIKITCELPYCKVTSCENELIAEQAAEIWPNFHKFVDHLMSLP